MEHESRSDSRLLANLTVLEKNRRFNAYQAPIDQTIYGVEALHGRGRRPASRPRTPCSRQYASYPTVAMGTERSRLNHGLALGQHEACTDQRKVAERLWEVAKLSPFLRIVFFGEQSQIIAG